MSSLVGRPATAADVAAAAGVSRATVSHILNGRASSFAEATRSRVLAAAADLDYRPSPAGRQLVRGRGDTIVVLAPHSTIGPNQQDAVDRLIADTATFTGNVVLRFADADPDSTVVALLRLRPLAVVDLGALSQPARDRLRSQGVPTVPRIDDSGVTHLEVEIARLQVGELQRRTPRPIVYAGLHDRRPDPFSARRFTEIERFCAESALPEPIRVDVPPDPEGAHRALGPVLSRGAVGVAAYNDLVALATASVASQMGLRIPDDVAIIGMDATPAMQLVSPRITSIAVNMDSYIDRAMNDLAAEIDHPISVPRPSNTPSLRLASGEST